MKNSLIASIFLLIVINPTYAQTTSKAPMSDEKTQKALQQLSDIGQCIGIANAYRNKGGELSAGNRKYFADKGAFDKYFTEAVASVKECRAGNPQDPLLHENCMKQLPSAKQALYEGYLTGRAKMLNSLQEKRDDKVGVLLLSCSA